MLLCANWYSMNYMSTDISGCSKALTFEVVRGSMDQVAYFHVEYSKYRLSVCSYSAAMPCWFPVRLQVSRMHDRIWWHVVLCSVLYVISVQRATCDPCVWTQKCLLVVKSTLQLIKVGSSICMQVSLHNESSEKSMQGRHDTIWHANSREVRVMLHVTPIEQSRAGAQSIHCSTWTMTSPGIEPRHLI